MTITTTTSLDVDQAHEAIEHGAMQKPGELAGLLGVLRSDPPRIVVEIGTHRGGTFWAWCQIATPDAFLVSIDLPGGHWGGGYSLTDQAHYETYLGAEQTAAFLRQDSHDPATRDHLKHLLGPDRIDFLFIDGDHTHEGVAQDYWMFAPLVRHGGLIAFHDITRHPVETRVNVEAFWREIRHRHPGYREFVDPSDTTSQLEGATHRWTGWGGIGAAWVIQGPI